MTLELSFLAVINFSQLLLVG